VTRERPGNLCAAFCFAFVFGVPQALPVRGVFVVGDPSALLRPTTPQNAGYFWARCVALCSASAWDPVTLQLLLHRQSLWHTGCKNHTTAAISLLI